MLGAFRDCLDDDAYRNVQDECLAWFRQTRGIDWSQEDMHQAYKMAFGMRAKVMREETVNHVEGRKTDEAPGDTALQRTRRANASNQAAAFLTSAISSRVDELTCMSSRSVVKREHGCEVVDDDKHQTSIKEESNDEEGLRTSDTADRSAANPRQAKTETHYDLDVSDCDKARRKKVQSLVPTQSSDAACSPQIATPNVR